VRGRARQSPLAYTRNTPILLTATIAVATPPTAITHLDIRATADFTDNAGNVTQLVWQQNNVQVNPAAPPPIQFPIGGAAAASNNPLPNEVGINDQYIDIFGNPVDERMPITWEASDSGANAWQLITQTSHDIYVVLGNPVGRVTGYWTLYAWSCSAARGITTPANVITQVYGLLQTAQGSPIGANPGTRRKRDNQTLTYYNPQATNATSARDILQRPDGSGQCCAWAGLLLGMHNIHGIDSSFLVRIEPLVTPPPLAAPDQGIGVGFLVKNWNFIPGNPLRWNAPNYYHLLGGAPNNRCVRAVQVVGQNSQNPSDIFARHFIVFSAETGRFYDPSYGTGPYQSPALWEGQSIDALYLTVNTTQNYGFLNLFTQNVQFRVAGYSKAAVGAPQMLLEYRLTPAFYNWPN
jgi:hypothetical protein